MALATLTEHERRHEAVRRHPHPELFQGLDDEAADRLYQYLFYTPSTVSARGPVRSTLKMRILRLRESQERVEHWPLELALDPYVGCRHGCLYCPSRPRLRAGEEPRPARGRSGRRAGFDKSLRQDLRDLEFVAPTPVPVYFSRETDPLQAQIEAEYRVTERALQAMTRSPERYTRVVLRTRNPAQLLDAGATYRQSIEALPAVVVEVCASFLSEEKRRIWEPGAPAVASRLDAVAALREWGVQVVLRAVPLLPGEPLSPLWFKAPTYERLGCPGPGPTLEELGELLGRAAEAGCAAVTYGPLLLPCGRGARSPQRKALGPLFRRANGRYRQRGGSFRLPEKYVAERLLPQAIDLAQQHGLAVEVARDE